MKRIFAAAFLAAATTAASWAVKRWLDHRYTRIATRKAHKPVETWENEGGSLSPHQVAIETSQVPR